MTLIREEYGCKVGWATYDDEVEARERGVKEEHRAILQEGRGYDFGYSVPGSVTQNKEGNWVVVTA